MKTVTRSALAFLAATAAAAPPPPAIGDETAAQFHASWHAALSASLPRYSPPPAAGPPRAAVVAHPVAWADAGEPVVVMPDFYVTERRGPPLRERDLLTPKGRADLAKRKYSSKLDRILNGHVLPLIGISIESRVLAEQAEDDRLAAQSDFARTARAIAQIDHADGAEYQRLADDADAR